MITRAFLASGFWVSARYLLIALSGILVTTGFARLGSKELLGQYQFILSLLALFSIFALPGLNLAALKAVSEKKPRAVIEAVHLSFRASLLALPFLLGYAVYLFIAGDRLLGATLIVASALFPFFYAPNTWYAYYEGRADFRAVALRTVLASFAVTAVVLVGLTLKLNVLWMVTVYLAISAVFSLYFYSEVRRLALRQSGDAADQDLDVPYGRRVTAQKFVYTLSESLPPLAVSFFLGHAALAGFQVANVFLTGVSGLIGALAIISLPRFFAEKNSAHRLIFWQNAVIGLLAAAGFWITVRLIFIPMYGEGYTESYRLALVLAGLPILISLRTFLVNYFTARDKNALIISIYLVANTLALISFALAVRSLSFVAAASTYLYTLNSLLFLPLFTIYLLAPQKKASETTT